jgi:hypothetical protein
MSLSAVSLNIQGKTKKAAEAFANAIITDPNIMPTETIFPIINM